MLLTQIVTKFNVPYIYTTVGLAITYQKRNVLFNEIHMIARAFFFRCYFLEVPAIWVKKKNVTTCNSIVFLISTYHIF